MGRPITHFSALAKVIDEVYSGKALRILDIGAGLAEYWLQDELGNLCAAGVIGEVVLLDGADAKTFSGRPTSMKPFRRLQGIVPAFLTELEDKEFDIVVAFDLIEHLSVEDGYLLLYEMDRISSQSVGLYTPNGFVWQPPAYDNPINAHISGWNIRDLKSFGYDKFFGHVGWKPWIGPYAEPKFGIYTSSVLSGINLLSLNFPSGCFAFSAWKSVDKIPRVTHQFKLEN